MQHSRANPHINSPSPPIDDSMGVASHVSKQSGHSPSSGLNPRGSHTTSTGAINHDKPQAAALHQQQQQPAEQLARAHVAAFATPDNLQGAWAVLLTCGLWVGGFSLGRVLFQPTPLSSWWGWLLAAMWLFLRVGSHVRAFAVMHEAVHYSIFTHAWLNELAATVSGLLITLDASDFRKTHGQHHAVLGMEDEVHKDPDLMVIYTTKEWAAWPRGASKFLARLMRDPVVFYTLVAPVYVLLFNAAWPQRVSHQSLKGRTLYILARAVSVCCWIFGLTTISGGCTHVMAELMGAWIATCYAMFLYSVEHAYEGVYLVPRSHHSRTVAAIAGSSCLCMAWWFKWATFGVEYHHIHHVNARVPGYRLQECHESAPPGLWESLGLRTLGGRTAAHTILLSLWDSDAHCYTPFPEWRWLEKILMPEKYTL